MSAVLEPQGVFLPAPAPTLPPFPRLSTASHRAAAKRAEPARGRGVGLAVVVGIHVLVGWALASGLARHVVDLVRKPIDAAVIDDTPPPPPPPPPKVERIVQAPKPFAPPPAYVPPPEVTPAPAPPAPTIVATQAEPAPPPAPVAPPAPPAAPPVPAVAHADITLACPGYQAVVAQGLEDAFDRVGIAGIVRTRLTVRGAQVVDATPVSGPKEYYKFVQAAVKRMHCSAGGADEVQVNLDVQFSR